MKKNKGQALIEFIIVLPILALMITAMADTYNLMHKTYELENDLNTIVTFYQNNDDENIEKLLNKNKLSIYYETDTTTTKIILKKNIRIVTPVMSNILGNPHTITVSRVVYNEEK